ncbi:MAG: hypothetical protein ACYTG5_22500 [Planctomycetota bacterium]|jgi:hypothetical protein
MLEKDFVLGWKDIRRTKHVGYSFGYKPKDSSVGTTNGAGPHNVQIFVLSPDRVVLHALPGFWHPEDLAAELRFAKVLARLWSDENRSLDQKRDMYRRLQEHEIRRQSEASTARSGWQGFDRRAEADRLAKGPRDTFYPASDGMPPALKPINLLVHERMAERPFVAFEDFDTEAFVDYGRLFYDLNSRVDGRGIEFKSLAPLRKKRARLAKIEAKREAQRARAERRRSRR